MFLCGVLYPNEYGSTFNLFSYVFNGSMKRCVSAPSPFPPTFPRPLINTFREFSVFPSPNGLSFTCFTLLQLSLAVYLLIFGAVIIFISSLDFTHILMSFVFLGGPGLLLLQE